MNRVDLTTGCRTTRCKQRASKPERWAALPTHLTSLFMKEPDAVTA